MTMRKTNGALLALVLSGAVGACQDLNVTDENLPDTERALGEPAAVETVIKSAFQIWFDYLHNYQDIYYWFPMIADEMTSRRGVISGHIHLVAALIPQLHPFIDKAKLEPSEVS